LTRKYILKYLGCASCADKIERAVNRLEGVKSANLNFATSTLTVETTREDSTAAIKSVVYSYEPDVLVIEKGGETTKTDSSERTRLIRLIIGAATFAAGILSGRFADWSHITTALFVISYLVLGADVIWKALRNILRGRVFDENFLIAIATIGAFAIGEHAEAVAVMLFYGVGKFFEERAVGKSKKSIAKLMDIRPDFARIKNENQLIEVDPETVEIGDIIVVKAGEKIPLDGIILDGQALLDTAALTGESVPRSARVDDTVLSGCVNKDGLLTIQITKPYGQSTAQRIIDLVENAANKKAPTEKFITKFARYYTPVVVILAALIAIIPPLFWGDWSQWIHRGLIFLVISCPCALVISIPLGFFGGIGGAARRGILFKGGNYLQALNNLEIAVFDKTGTLTKGAFEVTKVEPATGFTKEDLLEAAAKAEVFSNHPIAASIIREYGKDVDKSALSEYKEIAGHGISVNDGCAEIIAGNIKLMRQMSIEAEEIETLGTKVYVGISNKCAGCIIISDEIKKDSREAIATLKSMGVTKTVMLSGDNYPTAEAVCRELGIDEVYAELLPEQKVEKLELLTKEKHLKGKLAFIGDGINDAPVLAMADIGVAMGGLGSDAAIEAADVVLMTDEPSKLAEAVSIARFTNRIVWQNIIFALGVKGLFLILGAFGVASMWEAVFADVGVTVLAVFNAMRVLRMGRQ